MVLKVKEKVEAIKLRRRGFSYSEILKEISVAKSTLSLWLGSVGLSKKQKQRLTKKKLAAALRGAKARKDQRLSITKDIKDKARKEIGTLSKRELWLIGIAFYWAEGAKQKENNPSQKVKFSNSDPRAVKVFIKWLKKICHVSKKDILFRIALHENHADRLDEVQKYWAHKTNFSIDCFQKIDWKKNKIKTKRKNIGKAYFGLVDVYIRKSTNFNRKISGWIEGICKKI